MYLNMISIGLYVRDSNDFRTLSLKHMLTHAFHAESEVTTYQERISSDLTKMLERIRHSVQDS